MILYNTFIVKSPYSGKSKFDFWNNIEIGNIMKISIKLNPPGKGRSLYATLVSVECNGVVFTDSLTSICNYLDKIEVEKNDQRS